jgi:hypothetical protein
MDSMEEAPGRSRGPWARRLIAEFVVIVAGVLVALAVNAAWEARSERVQELEYYRSLARDLVSDTAEYHVALRMTARSIEAALHVRAVALGEEPTSPRPLSLSLEYASWVNYPDWSSGTVEELYGAGTIRLLRDQRIKDALHTYRALVNEWRPRMQGDEYSAFLRYRLTTAGFLPLEAAIAYEVTSLDDESAMDVAVDEAGLARRIRGDDVLLRDTELMIIEWAHLVSLYEEQKASALALLNLLEERTEGQAGDQAP